MIEEEEIEEEESEIPGFEEDLDLPNLRNWKKKYWASPANSGPYGHRADGSGA